MIHRRFTFWLAGMAGLVLLAGCALRTRAGQVTLPPALEQPSPTRLAVTLPPAETPATSEPPAQPTQAAQPSATTAPSPTVVIVPNQPATITAEGVNLRQGPGTLFDRLGQLSEGAQVTAIGKARGDDWLYISDGNREGWLAVVFTSLYRADKLAAVPLKEPGSAVVVTGQVTQSNGMPLAGIEFAAFQGKEATNPPDTRAHSLADGYFYLYLPSTARGVWRVSLTAVDCKSPIVDASCRYTGAFMPRFQDVTLPQTTGLSFQYSP